MELKVDFVIKDENDDDMRVINPYCCKEVDTNRLIFIGHFIPIYEKEKRYQAKSLINFGYQRPKENMKRILHHLKILH